MMKPSTVDNGRLHDAQYWDDLDRALKRFGYQQDALIEVLHFAQETFGYLSPTVLEHIAQELKLPLSWVFGVASFYHFFSLEEAPAHTCVICTGTACHVEGAPKIISLLEKEIGIKVGETTADGKFNLVNFRCPGSCSLAPILVLDGKMLGRETPTSVLEKVNTLLKNGAEEETAV